MLLSRALSLPLDSLEVSLPFGPKLRLLKFCPLFWAPVLPLSTRPLVRQSPRRVVLLRLQSAHFHLSAFICAAQKRIPKLSKMFLFKPSTESAQIYNPAKSKYDAVEDAVWKKNEKVPFIALAQTFAAIEEQSGRLKSIEIMSNYFCSVMHLSSEDLVKSVYLCLNKVCPDYENIELGK